MKSRPEHVARMRLGSLLQWALLTLGLVATTAGGYALGAWIGSLVLDGFVFDWYAHAPARALAGNDLTFWSARVAGAAALAGASLALLARLSLPRTVRARRDATTRSAHALATLVVAPAFAALATGVAAHYARPALPERALLAGVGALACGAAFAAAWAWTSARLAQGAIAARGEGTPLLSRIMLVSARAPRSVLAAVLAVSLVAGIGASTLTTQVDVVDVLPRGDPNSASAVNLSEEFKSTFTLQVTLHVRVAPERHAAEETRHLPYRGTQAQPDNITDEVYVRAQDELVRFVKSYVPEGEDHAPFRSSVGLPSFYRLINWTIAGGRTAPDEAYALPEATTPAGSSRYAVVHEGVWSQIPAAASALLSPDYRQSAILFLVAPDEDMTSKEIGEAALAMRDAYVEWAESTPGAYKVFTGDNAPRFTVDLPLADAHQSEMTEKDFRLLLPLIGAFILVCLVIQFRDLRAPLIAFGALGVSVLWTFGVMGFLGLPFNTVNLTVVPLIMGVGIDYGIHVLNEYQHGRAHGLTAEETFRRVGARSALSLFIATATSILGVAVMIVSPSLLIAQLGLLCCVALASTYLLTVTLIPAASTLLRPGRRAEYRPSRGMRAIAVAAGRYRYATLSLIALASVAALVAAQGLERDPFGDPPRNWPEDDPLRLEHEAAGKDFYASPTPDAKANVIVFEGDVFHPDAHRYMDALEAELREQPRVVNHTLRTVPFIMRTYLTIRDGAPGAAQFNVLSQLEQRGAPGAEDPYPDTREEVVALAEEAAATPLREFADLFYAWPQQDIAVMTFTARAATFDEAVEVWDQVWAAVDAVEDQRPEGLKVAFVGNTATNYLFVEKQVPWIDNMAPVVAIAVVALVLVLTRDVKAAVVVGVHNLATGLLWLGLLPALGIGLSITLTLPLIFIFAMGSDYGLHLSLACRDEDSATVFETTGKAIIFSAVTTFGAFAIFAQVSNLAVQRAMVATAAAIVVIFLVTALLVPAFYPSRRPDEAPQAAPDASSSQS